MEATTVEFLYQLGIGLVIVGVFIFALVVFLIVLRAQKSKVKAAGAVIIGPVPIIFGTDKKSLKTVLTLSVVLTGLLIIFTVVYYYMFR